MYLINICLAFFLLLPTLRAQDTYYAVASGNWSNASSPIWADSPGGDAQFNDPDDPNLNVVIPAGITVTMNVSGREVASLTVESGGTLTRAAGTTQYVEVHGPDMTVNGTVSGNVGLAPRGSNIRLSGSGSTTFGRIRKANGGACELLIDMDVTVDYSGSTAAITNQSGGVTGSGTLDITIAAGRRVNVLSGNVSIDGADGTNNNEGDGSITVNGVLDIQNGDLLLITDNDAGNPITYAVAADGLLRVNGQILGNTGVPGGATANLNLTSGGQLELAGAGASFQDLDLGGRDALTFAAGSSIKYAGSSGQQLQTNIPYQD